MGIPVIIRNQSVPEFLQHQEFEIQNYATNDPTFWNCSPLPSGVSFDLITGRIHGAANFPGVFTYGLIAGNADGVSAIETYVMGIEATNALPSIDAIDLSVDLATGEVTVGQASTRKLKRGSGDAAQDVTPLFWLKRGDIRMLQVRFTKGGVTADIALNSLKLALKAFEPEDILVSSSAFIRCDTGPNTFYRFTVSVAGGELDDELSDDEKDFGTEFAALGELEWTWVNNLTPAFGPALLRSSSLNFDVGIARDLNKPDAT